MQIKVVNDFFCTNEKIMVYCPHSSNVIFNSMTAKSNFPTRVCSACGIEKPLSAFLQISGLKGSGYGNICSTCRGAGMDSPLKKPEKLEDRGSTSSDVRIDADSRQVAELEQKKAAAEKDQATREDREAKEKLTDFKDRKITREQFEKHVREELIKSKSIFSQPGQKTTDAKARTENLARSTAPSEVERAVESKLREEEAAKTEAGLTGIDLSRAFNPEQLRRINVLEGEAIKRFGAWTSDAPIVKQLGFLKRKTSSQKLYKQPTEKTPEAKQEKDPVLDFTERKKWGSSFKK